MIPTVDIASVVSEPHIEASPSKLASDSILSIKKKVFRICEKTVLDKDWFPLLIGGTVGEVVHLKDITVLGGHLEFIKVVSSLPHDFFKRFVSVFFLVIFIWNEDIFDIFEPSTDSWLIVLFFFFGSSQVANETIFVLELSIYIADDW